MHAIQNRELLQLKTKIADYDGDYTRIRNFLAKMDLAEQV